MPQSATSLEHRGSTSVVALAATKQQLDAFCSALLKKEFVLKTRSPQRLEFHRSARVLKDDWPIRLRIERRDDWVEIYCSMFIPWSWIGIFSVLVVLFLPVVSASGVPPLLLLGLGLAVVAVAAVKQQFDLSPHAFWQSRPRKRWSEILNGLLANAFK